MLHAFAVGGVYMITDDNESRKFVFNIIVGCLSVIFLEEVDCSWVSSLFIMPLNAYHI